MKTIYFFIFLLIGCAPALYLPSAENVGEGADLAELKKGREIYVNHCGSCHGLHLPGEFSKDEWATHLEKMQLKANISEWDKMLILSYLTSERNITISTSN